MKIEETAQGIRIHVHVYRNDRNTALSEVFAVNKEAKQLADKENILLSPKSIKEVKK